MCFRLASVKGTQFILYMRILLSGYFFVSDIRPVSIFIDNVFLGPKFVYAVWELYPFPPFSRCTVRIRIRAPVVWGIRGRALPIVVPIQSGLHAVPENGGRRGYGTVPLLPLCRFRACTAVCRLYQMRSRACFISSIISSAFSIPTDRRIRSGAIPAWRSCSSESCRCVWLAG